MNSNDRLKNLERFFDIDVAIKKKINQLFPKDSDFYFDEIERYVQKLFDLLKTFRIDFIFITKAFDLDYLEKEINTFFDNLEVKLESTNGDRDRIMDFYSKYIVGNFSEDFLNEVRNRCVGYLFFKDVYPAFVKALSVNELLHFYHSYIVNNEKFYNDMPLVSEKKNVLGHSINLYGNCNDETFLIFNNFPDDLDVNRTDILSLQNRNKVIMMIRNKAHALSIEMTFDKENVLVEYFIPKICNVEKVNQLRGVNKVSENSSIFCGTVGSFMSSRDQFYEELFEFISKVPSDDDINLNL